MTKEQTQLNTDKNQILYDIKNKEKKLKEQTNKELFD